MNADNSAATLPGALDGVRVVDMTAIGMGPWATQMLADMGADVIKVEPPGGDVFRHVTPQRHAGMSHAYLNLNRNKRSVVLDAKREADRSALLALIARADVFVSNVRPRALARLGLEYPQLRERNPRLIYCGCYGYSEAGPYAGRPGVDDTIQAASSLAWFQGGGNDDGGRTPRYVNSIIADKVSAMWVAQSIAFALYARERSGVGQAIEVPMFESMVAFMMVEHSSAEWVTLLEAADLPFAPVNSVDDLLIDPHLKAVGFCHSMEHPTEGSLTMPGIPVRYSATPGSIRWPPPALGEHTAEVLAELGLAMPDQETP